MMSATGGKLTGAQVAKIITSSVDKKAFLASTVVTGVSGDCLILSRLASRVCAPGVKALAANDHSKQADRLCLVGGCERAQRRAGSHDHGRRQNNHRRASCARHGDEEPT